MNILSKPFRWISAHREATFTFEYSHTYEIFGSSDVDGKFAVAFYSDGINALVAGDYFFISSGVYRGLHKVTEVFSSQIYITDTDYTSSITSGDLTFVEDHIFTIYSGYTSGDLAVIHPYTLIATFKPEVNYDGQLVVNISGYVNKIFDVINSNEYTNLGAYSVYYNLFNAVTVLVDGVILSTHMVLNSAITQYELNRDYVGTGRSLNGGSLGNHYLSCGDTENIQIVGDLVILGEEFVDATPVPAPANFFSADFNTNDFLTTGG